MSFTAGATVLGHWIFTWVFADGQLHLHCCPLPSSTPLVDTGADRYSRQKVLLPYQGQAPTCGLIRTGTVKKGSCPSYGRVSEWFKELVLKTSDTARYRGFESLLFRQIKDRGCEGYFSQPRSFFLRIFVLLIIKMIFSNIWLKLSYFVVTKWNVL